MENQVKCVDIAFSNQFDVLIDLKCHQLHARILGLIIAFAVLYESDYISLEIFLLYVIELHWVSKRVANFDIASALRAGKKWKEL